MESFREIIEGLSPDESIQIYNDLTSWFNLVKEEYHRYFHIAMSQTTRQFRSHEEITDFQKKSAEWWSSKIPHRALETPLGALKMRVCRGQIAALAEKIKRSVAEEIDNMDPE